MRYSRRGAFFRRHAAAAISLACYVENRTALGTVSKIVSPLGIDMISSIFKEFWPDLERRIFR
jgi:hypothetical protein